MISVLGDDDKRRGDEEDGKQQAQEAMALPSPPISPLNKYNPAVIQEREQSFDNRR